MSYRTWLRCSNDHLFLCPRKLCSPYSTLLRNFERSDCVPQPGFASGGNGVKEDGSLRPPPIISAIGYYISRAYNGTDCGVPRLLHPKCCGRVREMGILYAIARGSDSFGFLICGDSLVGSWRPDSIQQVDPLARSCAIRWCRLLTDLYSGATLRKVVNGRSTVILKRISKKSMK